MEIGSLAIGGCSLAKCGFQAFKLARLPLAIEGAEIAGGFALKGLQFAPEEIAVTTATRVSRHRLSPNSTAGGPHTVFRRDPTTGAVSHYETFILQTNPYDPKPWQSILRYDGASYNTEGHFNKVLMKYIPEPHVHDPHFPGKIRPANPCEIPMRVEKILW